MTSLYRSAKESLSSRASHTSPDTACSIERGLGECCQSGRLTRCHSSRGGPADTLRVARAFPDGTADFRSDTVPRPTAEMRRAMSEAEVGDDSYGEDPTVNLLQEEAAASVGKEEAVL